MTLEEVKDEVVKEIGYSSISELIRNRDVWELEEFFDIMSERYAKYKAKEAIEMLGNSKDVTLEEKLKFLGEGYYHVDGRFFKEIDIDGKNIVVENFVFGGIVGLPVIKKPINIQ